MNSLMKSVAIRGLLVFSVVCVGACASTTHTEVVKPASVEFQVRNVPGVVEYVWQPPMINQVVIPPGLDPEGVYYRPGHEEVVEIRQGRWQYYSRQQQ